MRTVLHLLLVVALLALPAPALGAPAASRPTALSPPSAGAAVSAAAQGARSGAQAKKGKKKGKRASTQGRPQRPELPDALGFELGEYGTEYAQPAAELVAAHAVHGDTTGGCPQVLQVVTGSPTGGFAGVWRDHRTASGSLFLGSLDTDGNLLRAERPLTEQLGTARELDADLGLGPDGRGAFVWMKTGPNPRAHLRFIDTGGAWSGAIPLGSRDYNRAIAAKGKTPQGRGGAGPAAGRAAVPDAREAEDPIGIPARPAVAVDDTGRTAVTWHESGRAYLQMFHERYPVRAPMRINPGGLPAQDRVLPALGPDGRLLCAWTTREGVHVRAQRGPATTFQGVSGPGLLSGARPDPTGGWWLLVRHESRLALRHLDADGEPDRPDVTVMNGPVLGASFATWAYGVAVCVELVVQAPERDTAPAGPRRAITVTLLGPGGEKPDGGAGEPLVIEASPLSRGASIASESPFADRLLLAWTDRPEGNDDVLSCLLTRDEPGRVLSRSEPRVWNTDEGSADQLHGAIASNGERAVLAWEDDRWGPGRIVHRRLGVDGAWLGEEEPVGPSPPGDGDVEMRRASVAVHEDGGCFVTWKEAPVGGRVFRVRGQAFDAHGKPLCEPFDLDPGLACSPGWAAAVDALPGRRGFVVVWVRDGYGPVSRRVSVTGAPGPKAWDLADGRGEKARNPSVATLDDGRCIAVWDFVAADGAKVLAGRFLAPDTKPDGVVLSFEFGGAGGDLDPEVAPAGLDGFLLAWTTRDGPGRDSIARFFDREGTPTGPPLAMSVSRNEQDYTDVVRLADGSWLVAWEDDLSAVDHAVARRILPDRRTLGPRFTLDPRKSRNKEVRHAPRIAALGDGVAALWADSSRNRGQDVFLRVLGPDFDDGVEEPTHEER